MSTARRRYGVRFALWMSVYVVAVVLQATAFNLHIVPRPLVIPVALLPMIPAVLAAFATLDRLRTLDELERKIQAEGIQFSFLITAMVTFSYGFLEGPAHFPRLSMSFVWPVLAVFWAIGSAIASRRYR